MDKILILCYAVFLLVGAVMGAKAGSRISLIAGLVSSLITLVGYYLLSQGVKTGYWVVIAVSGLLSLTFLIRFIKTGNFMPSGMLLAVSLLILVVTIKFFLKTP